MIKKTYNPIKREEPYQNGFMPKIPIPAPKCAIILIAKKAGFGMMAITEQSKVKKSEIQKGKYDYLAEIDMHQYNIHIEIQATSNDQISDFTIAFSGVAEVTEPDVVYREQIRDVAQHIENGILADIQSMAANCRISERDFLKQNIENRFGAQVYVDSGISVRNINVLVRCDAHYEKLLEEKRRIHYQKELDEVKSKAADEAKQRFSDPGTAAYKEYIEGSKTASEANALWREEEERNFDMRIRQAKEYMKVAQQFENAEWVNSDQISQNATQILQRLAAGDDGVSAQSRISMQNKDKKEDINLYGEFED